ncbi:MAG: ATP-binding protein [Saprospiraceae bacterium]|nr:ATP-binding protein [Saprospiraceae bacterium]
MKQKAIILPRRYPGLKPFERSQQAVFHGRQDDVQRLSNLVLREKLVVLFAKSGIGKTSLLQAGVAPELERQEFVPLLLRTERTDQALLTNISERLANAPQLSGRNTTGERPGQPQTLWEQLKRLEFDLNGLPATPVLVFDQFEETFTLSHKDTSRISFLNQLADLANGTMPESLRSDLLRDFNAGTINMETMHWWEQQPDLRIVLSIRSDFLHMLDSMSNRIPGILKNRYHLQPLDREKARVAIIMPAQAEGQFASPKFNYTEPALLEMIDFLAGNVSDDKNDIILEASKKDNIEAVNLQIVCMDVEERIIDHQQAADFQVTPDYYNGKEGLHSSIRNFYANQLELFPKAYVERIEQKKQQGSQVAERDLALAAKVPPKLELRGTSSQVAERDLALAALPVEALNGIAQRLIEESLITPGNRRNSVVDDTLIAEHDISSDFLDTLVDKSRLLRKEPRIDDFYYEISHDTLLPAIIESRNQRREKERIDSEKAAYEVRLAEEAKRRESIEKELKTTRRQRRLARTVAALSVLLMISMVVFGIWYAWDYRETAIDQLEKAEENTRIERFDAAKEGYFELARHTSRQWLLQNMEPPKFIHEERVIVDSLSKLFEVASLAEKQANDLQLVNEFSKALTAYQTANDAYVNYLSYINGHPLATKNGQRLRVDTHLVNVKLNVMLVREKSVYQTIIREFKISQRDYEVFEEAGLWGQALRNLNQMQKLLPEDKHDRFKLQNDVNLHSSIEQYIETRRQTCIRNMQ